VYGATFAAPIWKKFTDSYMADKPAPGFEGVAPKAVIGDRPFVVPAGAPILAGSGGAAAPGRKSSKATVRKATPTPKKTTPKTNSRP